MARRSYIIIDGPDGERHAKSDPSIVARNRKAAASRVRVAEARTAAAEEQRAQRLLEAKMAGAWDEAGTVTVPTLAEIRARVDAAVARMKGAA